MYPELADYGPRNGLYDYNKKVGLLEYYSHQDNTVYVEPCVPYGEKAEKLLLSRKPVPKLKGGKSKSDKDL